MASGMRGDAVAIEAEAGGAEADLPGRLLAADIGHGLALDGEEGGGLEHEGRLADTGVAADEEERAGHDAAAEHAVEFGDAGREARSLLVDHFGEGDGASGGCFAWSSPAGGAGTGAAFERFEGVPFVALGAAAGVSDRLPGAVRTAVAASVPGHDRECTGVKENALVPCRAASRIGG